MRLSSIHLYLSIMMILLISVSCSKEDPEESQEYEVIWNYKYGDSGLDLARSIKQTSDNGFIVFGQKDPGGSSELYDWWLFKIDEDGEVLWEKIYDGYESDIASSIQETSDNGFILAGHSDSSDIGYCDGWIIKTDQEGNIIWEKIIGGEGDDRIFSVQQMEDGCFIFAGSTKTNSTYIDSWLFKTDNKGNILWEITSNITDTDIYYSMEKTSDGCLILSGYVSSLNNESQARIVKVNTDGEILWEKTYGDLFSEYAEIAIETIDNGYIVGCYRHEWFSQKEVRLIKTDESGNILWDRVVSKDYDCVLKDVKQTTDGDYIFVGQIGNNIWIANLDQYGNIMWELEDGGDHWDILFSIEMLEESQFIVAGFTYENTIGYSDAYILKAQYNHLVDSKNSLFEIQKTNSEIQ